MKKIFSTLVFACLFGWQLVQAQAANEIILYTDANFGGQSVTVTVGTYPNISSLGFPNSTASSIKVGSGVVAILHSCVDFGGGYSNGYRTYAANDADFTGDFWFIPSQACGGTTVNNNVNALWVMNKGCVPGPNEVSFFENTNFLGGCVTVPVGSYISPTLAGMPNDWAGSLKVGSNVSVKIWTADFQGSSVSYNPGSSVASLGIGDNTTSSLVVDGCPNDPNKIEPGICGCGVPETNTDGDNLPDCVDPDDDNDGVADTNDDCPNTPAGQGANAYGCSCSQVMVNDGDPCTLDECSNGEVTHTFQDADGDGVCNASDNCPNTPTGEGANASGCSCSQVTVDDGDPCTLDECTNGVVTHTFEDVDEDGVCNANDNCATVANNDQLDSDGDGLGDACDACDYALPNIPNFNESTCHCKLGYFEVTTLNGEIMVVTGCTLCPPGYYCPNGQTALPCAAGSYASGYGQVQCDACPPGSYSSTIASVACASCEANTYNPNSGQTACLACPQGTASEPGSTECTQVPVDSDCDGVDDMDDVCPGGEDSVDNNNDGIADCSQSLPYAQYAAAWKCANNKLTICHVDENGNRNELCINKNAIPAHIGHGDWAGPCIGCAQNISAPIGGNIDVAEGLQMELYPNPTSGKLTIDLHGLDENEDAMLTVFDQLGRVVAWQKIEAGSHQLQFDFAKQNLSSGEYFVRLTSGQGVVVRKLALNRDVKP